MSHPAAGRPYSETVQFSPPATHVTMQLMQLVSISIFTNNLFRSIIVNETQKEHRPM
jgi:hypothetical protein